MKSEFSTFCKNLESKLGADSIKMIINDTADFFDQMQQKIYGIDCPKLKKRKVREIQKLVTDFVDRLSKRSVDRDIITKVCKRLQLLKESHPELFNQTHPIPVPFFETAKSERKMQVAEIIECLETAVLDPVLKKILIDYLTFQHQPFRISPPSWRHLDYHDLLTCKLLPILKDKSEESPDWAIASFFHRYNFNTHAINDYCLRKIDACFSTNKPIDEISLKHWYHLLQNKPLEKLAYNPGFRSLSKDLKSYLEIKLDSLEDKGASIKSIYYPQYTYSTEVRILIEKLQAEAGYLVTPACWNKHYIFLREHTRGIRGHKVASKTYQNGSGKTSIKTYETVHTLLSEMLTINKNNMALAIKKLNKITR